MHQGGHPGDGGPSGTTAAAEGREPAAPGQEARPVRAWLEANYQTILLGETKDASAGVPGATAPRPDRPRRVERPSRIGRVSVRLWPEALKSELASRNEATVRLKTALMGSLDDATHERAVEGMLKAQDQAFEASYEKNKWRGASRSSVFRRVDIATRSLGAHDAYAPHESGTAGRADQTVPVWMRLSSEAGFTAAYKNQAQRRADLQQQQRGPGRGGRLQVSSTKAAVAVYGGRVHSGAARGAKPQEAASSSMGTAPPPYDGVPKRSTVTHVQLLQLGLPFGANMHVSPGTPTHPHEFASQQQAPFTHSPSGGGSSSPSPSKQPRGAHTVGWLLPESAPSPRSSSQHLASSAVATPAPTVAGGSNSGGSKARGRDGAQAGTKPTAAAVELHRLRQVSVEVLRRSTVLLVRAAAEPSEENEEDEEGEGPQETGTGGEGEEAGAEHLGLPGGGAGGADGVAAGAGRVDYGAWVGSIRDMMEDLRQGMEQIRSRLEASCIAGTAAAAALLPGPAPNSTITQPPDTGRELDSSLASSFASTDATADASLSQGDTPDSPTRGAGFPVPNPLSPYARQSLMRQHAALAEQRKSLAVVVGRLRRMTMWSPGGGGGSGGLLGDDGDGDGDEGSRNAGEEGVEGKRMAGMGREGGKDAREEEDECEELDEGGMAVLVEGLNRLAVVEVEDEEGGEEYGEEDEGQEEEGGLHGGSGEGEQGGAGRGGWLSSLAALGRPQQGQGLQGEEQQQVESAGGQQDDYGGGRPGTALGRSRGDTSATASAADGRSSSRGCAPPALPGGCFAPGQGGEGAGLAPGLDLGEVPVCSGVGVQLSARGSKPSTPRSPGGSRHHGPDAHEGGGASGVGQQRGSSGVSAAPGVVVVGEATSRPDSRGLQVSSLARGWTAASNSGAANVFDGFALPGWDGGGDGDSMRHVAGEMGSRAGEPRSGSSCSSSRAGWDPLRAFDPSGVSRQLLRQHPGLDLVHAGDRGEAGERGAGAGPGGRVPSIVGRPWSPAELMAGRPMSVTQQRCASPLAASRPAAPPWSPAALAAAAGMGGMGMAGSRPLTAASVAGALQPTLSRQAAATAAAAAGASAHVGLAATGAAVSRPRTPSNGVERSAGSGSGLWVLDCRPCTAPSADSRNSPLRVGPLATPPARAQPGVTFAAPSGPSPTQPLPSSLPLPQTRAVPSASSPASSPIPSYAAAPGTPTAADYHSGSGSPGSTWRTAGAGTGSVTGAQQERLRAQSAPGGAAPAPPFEGMLIRSLKQPAMHGTRPLLGVPASRSVAASVAGAGPGAGASAAGSPTVGVRQVPQAAAPVQPPPAAGVGVGVGAASRTASSPVRQAQPLSCDQKMLLWDNDNVPVDVIKVALEGAAARQYAWMGSLGGGGGRGRALGSAAVASAVARLGSVGRQGGGGMGGKERSASGPGGARGGHGVSREQAAKGHYTADGLSGGRLMRTLPRSHM